MTALDKVPRILIIDDLFGRSVPTQGNSERMGLCGDLLLVDETGDQLEEPNVEVNKPRARAVFCRAQIPATARVGDSVENDLEGALEVVASGWDQRAPGMPRWALVLLDLCFYTGKVTAKSESRRGKGMPTGRSSDEEPSSYFGLQLLDAIQARFPSLPVAVLSSKPRSEVSLNVEQLGAVDFLERGQAGLLGRLDQVLHQHGLLEDPQGEFVGRSLAVLFALREARRASKDRCLLLRGASGTGKELLARYVHRVTGRAGSLVPVNTPGLTAELWRSELFGHERGGFSGAASRRLGALRDAQGGDIFLDEIADLVPQVQAGILRVLQEKTIEPVGGQIVPIDVRFLAATNKPIEKAINDGCFRHDLFVRLKAGGELYLPRLMDRREDIPILVEAFVSSAQQEFSGGRVRDVHSEAMEKLVSHEWPGNVRELENCINRAVRTYPNLDHLLARHLDIEVETRVHRQRRSTADRVGPTEGEGEDNRASIRRMDALEVLDEWCEAGVVEFPVGLLDKDRLHGKGTTVVGGAATAILSYLALCVEITSDAKGFSSTRTWSFFTGTSGTKTSIARTHIAKLLLELMLHEKAFVAALDRSEALRWLVEDVAQRRKNLRDRLDRVCGRVGGRQGDTFPSGDQKEDETPA